jgi:hypothetical protein
MKKMAAPIPFDGSQLDQTRHISAFFNSADEEYRVLLPGGCFGRSDLRNARKVGFSASSVEVSESPAFRALRRHVRIVGRRTVSELTTTQPETRQIV